MVVYNGLQLSLTGVDITSPQDTKYLFLDFCNESFIIQIEHMLTLIDSHFHQFEKK